MESVSLTIITTCCLTRLLQLVMYGMTVANSDVHKLQDKCCYLLILALTISSILMLTTCKVQ